MDLDEPPKVAVIGVGSIGRGWAALAASAGWTVTVYDNEAAALHRAESEIRARAMSLVEMGRAEQETTERGLRALKVAPSLLVAVTDADWIIEATPEHLASKQQLFQQVEQVARLAAITTSSSSGLHASALCGRMKRPERLLVAHPLNPVELIPVVEVVPGPQTDPGCVEDLRKWLHGLGRVPIVLRREVPGNLVGRIAAAVWRECIHLVQEGVVDVEEVDQAIALGPSLGWTAAGPHLTYHLGAGDEGVQMFLSTLLGTFEQIWGELATWDRLDTEDQHRLVKAIERAYEGRIEELRYGRDRRLGQLLRLVKDENWEMRQTSRAE